MYKKTNATSSEPTELFFSSENARCKRVITLQIGIIVRWAGHGKARCGTSIIMLPVPPAVSGSITMLPVPCWLPCFCCKLYHTMLWCRCHICCRLILPGVGTSRTPRVLRFFWTAPTWHWRGWMCQFDIVFAVWQGCEVPVTVASPSQARGVLWCCYSPQSRGGVICWPLLDHTTLSGLFSCWTGAWRRRWPRHIDFKQYEVCAA